MSSYYDKYLKYKSKYMSMKNELKGGSDDHIIPNSTTPITSTSTPTSTYITSTRTTSEYIYIYPNIPWTIMPLKEPTITLNSEPSFVVKNNIIPEDTRPEDTRPESFPIEKSIQSINVENRHIIGKINKIGYEMFSIVCDNYMGITNKVLYIHCNPPSMIMKTNCVIPDDRQNNDDEKSIDDISMKDFIDFWGFSTTETYQQNESKSWKGGSWIKDSLITTSKDFFTGAYIGDTIELDVYAKGICYFGHNKNYKITDNSENLCYTCNGKISQQSPTNKGQLFTCNLPPIKEDKTYICYVSDVPMNHDIDDILLVYKYLYLNESSEEEFVYKICISRLNRLDDMPGKITPYIPGIENYNPYENYTIVKTHQEQQTQQNQQIQTQQDQQIPQTKITNIAVNTFRDQIYDDNFDIKKYKCYLIGIDNYKDKDPRYSYYYYNKKKFGISRNSENKFNIMFIDNITRPLYDLEDEDVKLYQNDRIFITFDQFLKIKDEYLMINDHKDMIMNYVLPIIEKFEQLKPEEKTKYLLPSDSFY